MIRRLLIVAASALALAVVTLSLAWVIGGDAIRAHLERDHSLVIGVDDDDGTPRASRTLAFDPAVPLVVNAPVDLEFVRGTTTEMTVEGRQSVIDRLEWQGGALSLKGKGSLSNGGISVRIVAPALPRLEINGPGKIEASGIDQPELAIELNGAGSVNVTGKAQRVKVDSSGAGSIDLSGLVASDATVSISGVGSAEVNATGTVDADISGAGSISLVRKPAVLNSRISGFGSIDHDY